LKKQWYIGIIQNRVTGEKTVNIDQARKMIAGAADKGARVVVLPEMFNCPYENEAFPVFSESYPGGETIAMLRETAADRKVYIIGGSIPEEEENRIYNTCFIFGPDGNLLARHRKAHLFDVELKEGLVFRESDVLSRGDGITVVDTGFGRIGVAICYDIRFPEVARIMALQGAKVMVVPAAFNMITGPAHWEVTLRTRALDNQLYVAGAAPARDEQASYVAYGHSMLVDPWGRVVESLDEKEGIIIAEIDQDRLEQVRNELPLLKHRRTDLYEIREI